jgi:hypothetical protein
LQGCSSKAALRRLRPKDVGRILWIDTICIFQDDISERGDQVELMAKIYSHASGVFVWLGEAPQDIDTEPSSPVSDIFMDYVGQMG